MSEKSRREQRLNGSATPQNIAQEFADVVRHLMRAATSANPQDAVLKATIKMEYVAELLGRSEEAITWHRLFSDTAEVIQRRLPEVHAEDDYIQAAMCGVKYFTEYNCSDSAAVGRASQRLDDFKRAIKWAEEAREARIGKIRRRK